MLAGDYSLWADFHIVSVPPSRRRESERIASALRTSHGWLQAVRTATPRASSYELLAWKAMRGLARSSSDVPPCAPATALAGISRLDAAGTLVRKEARAVGIATAHTLRRACMPSMERTRDVMALAPRTDEGLTIFVVQIYERQSHLVGTDPACQEYRGEQQTPRVACWAGETR